MVDRGLASGVVAVVVALVATPAGTRSVDEVDVRRVDEDELSAEQEQTMEDVLAVDGGFLAVGYDNPVDPEGSFERDGAVWESPDGRAWTRVTPTGFEGVPGDQFVRGIIATATGFLAVGSDDSTDPAGGAGIDSDAAVWTSTDGHTWTKVVGAGLEGVPGHQAMDDVVVADGGFVAVGLADDGAGSQLFGAVWTSADGQSWTQVDSEETGFRPRRDPSGPSGITVFGDGFVAVGSDPFGDGRAAAVWRSEDGIRWQKVKDRRLRDRDVAFAMNGVVPVEGFLIAVGWQATDRSDEETFDVAVWTSTDGRKWRRLRLESGAGERMNGIAPGVGALVVVGEDASSGPDDVADAAAWEVTVTS